jgi:hypothetical protein
MTENITKNNNKFIGKIKKFNQKLYDKYDTPARAIVKEILGDNVEDNPDIYNEDMILKIDNCKYKYLELQVCVNWIDEKYPYSKPFVYARKSKFSEDTLFLILNKAMTHGLIFDRKSLLDIPRRLKLYSRYFVYEVPWYRVMRINLEVMSIETFQLYA